VLENQTRQRGTLGDKEYYLHKLAKNTGHKLCPSFVSRDST